MIHQSIMVLFVLLFSAIGYAQDESTIEFCDDCHSGSENKVSVVTQKTIDLSAHEGTDCIECHENISELPHSEKLERVNCGNCHEDEEAIYQKHGRIKTGSDSDIPSCADCHGSHEIMSSTDKKSQAHPLNLPQTCGQCHEDAELTKEYPFLPRQPVLTYQSSVHGKAVGKGTDQAATCNDCHSSEDSAHQILSPGDPKSAINHFAIPRTCGQCHKEIEQDYREGIHGQLFERGEIHVPVCTSCHGEHRILPHEDPKSSVSTALVVTATCAPCHDSASLNEKYGMPAGKPASYIDSYHGLKNKAGDISVANCASCHGAHRILPRNNPSSSVHIDHLQETCGKCHPGISKAIAETTIHDFQESRKEGWPYIFSVLYFILITVMISAMVIYIKLDMWRYIRNLMKTDQVRRMSKWALWQHTLLLVAFVSLVITGFALRYEESWLTRLLFGWEGGFSLRNQIHRIAAVALVLTSLMHLVYLKSSKGTAFIKAIIPNKNDLKLLFGMLKYNLGFSNKGPALGRFSYIEKFEYWAVIWGTIIMTVTGTMLWFDNFFIGIFSKVVLDVMRVIHYYEAWLATLSILIWHLYSTVFNPKVYPMNPSWLTGTIPKEQYQDEHPDDPL